jgi:succinate dehydrogenase / fumarate reductase membrane anchor subunit
MSGGSSHDRGTGHFVRERLTSFLLIPLTVWIIATLVAYAGADHAAVVALLTDPINGILMTALVVIGLYHSVLGVQVVVEDYFFDPQRRALLIVNWIAHLLVGAVCLYAIARLVF